MCVPGMLVSSFGREMIAFTFKRASLIAIDENCPQSIDYSSPRLSAPLPSFSTSLLNEIERACARKESHFRRQGGRGRGVGGLEEVRA